MYKLKFKVFTFFLSETLSKYSVIPQEEDFQELEDAARRMEHQFSQLFDHVIVNEELHESSRLLLTAVRHAQDQPHWVPTCWLHPSEESWESRRERGRERERERWRERGRLGEGEGERRRNGERETEFEFDWERGRGGERERILWSLLI